jgi:tetratricopeptide (TPR) repeat protein
MFQDPVVRWLALGAALLVVLYLVTVVSALVMGLMTPDVPRTRGERDVRFYELSAMQAPQDPVVWQEYIGALITNRQYLKAQDVIDQANGVIEQTGTEGILTSQAQLYFAQKKYDQAIAIADKVIESLSKYHENAKKKTDSPEAKGAEINNNFYAALIVKAEAQAALGKPDAAIETLDIYLKDRKTAADVLIRRGNLKAEVGDKQGAEDDFRNALQFLPDNAAALEGLKKIGAEQ